MRKLAVLLFVLAAPVARAEGDNPRAVDLLADADRARGGLEKGVTWNVTVVDHADGETGDRLFKVKSAGKNAAVESLSPPRNKGEIMIFNDRTLWYTKPGLRKPVSISVRQRLSGLAANGDLASTNYARDYDATITGEEVVDGQPAWRMELKSRSPNVTYDRVRYWVSKERHLALKAEFLTVEGELFKSAKFEYTNQLDLGGQKVDLVSRMIISDAASKDFTELLYASPRAEEHPTSEFNINNLAW